MRQIRVEIPDELHRRVRVLAARRLMTLKAIVYAALVHWVEDQEGTDG